MHRMRYRNTLDTIKAVSNGDKALIIQLDGPIHLVYSILKMNGYRYSSIHEMDEKFVINL